MDVLYLPKIVSIPYKRVTNVEGLFDANDIFWEFQSPISGSQTSVRVLRVVPRYLFQSPISGSQTLKQLEPVIQYFEVSIPYKRVTN